MYNPPGKRGQDKFENRWEEGIWLGIADRTNEVIVGTSEGVIKVRDVRRYGIDRDKWDLAKFNDFKGVPWEPVPGREGIELKCRVNIPRDNSRLEPPMVGEARDPIRRRARITREMVRMLVFTVGCEGCRAINRNLPAVNHNETCRKRFESHMRANDDPRVVRADQRLGRSEQSQQQDSSMQDSRANVDGMVLIPDKEGAGSS